MSQGVSSPPSLTHRPIYIPNHYAWYVVPRTVLGNILAAHFCPQNTASKGTREKDGDDEGCF
ncbi:MAG: hypothetical protein VB997_01155 [Opitutales bacterium]